MEKNLNTLRTDSFKNDNAWHSGIYSLQKQQITQTANEYSEMIDAIINLNAADGAGEKYILCITL